jgi:alanyl-tRNA synthetase
MQYLKNADGSLTELPQKNIDFGGGLVRLGAALQNNPDVFLTDIYQPLIQYLESETKNSYQDPENQIAMRVIADHFTAAVFLSSMVLLPVTKLRLCSSPTSSTSSSQLYHLK